MKNKNLTKAKAGKNDEFYTQLSDIENELKHYARHFMDKVVYCNCDDPRISNFFQYFSLNFHKLGIKKLITTCYKNQDRDLFSKNNSKQAISLEYNGEFTDNIPNPEQIGIKHLQGDGDFRSPECVEILKQADIVVTNPPFSLWREYLAQLIEYNKQFIIIGNFNAVKYKDVFPLIKENKIWLGKTGMGMTFQVPDNYELSSNTGKIINGKKYSAVPACWFTNMPNKRQNEELFVYKKYYGNEEYYPKYDNYDAINIDKINEIPCDYAGVMGVPITFLDKYNPEQFEILGQGQGNLLRELTANGLKEEFVVSYYKNGGKGSIKAGHPILGYYDNNNKPVIPYMRILIKNKKPEVQ